MVAQGHIAGLLLPHPVIRDVALGAQQGFGLAFLVAMQDSQVDLVDAGCGSVFRLAASDDDGVWLLMALGQGDDGLVQLGELIAVEEL